MASYSSAKTKAKRRILVVDDEFDITFTYIISGVLNPNN
jgi:hypothetical protein